MAERDIQLNMFDPAPQRLTTNQPNLNQDRPKPPDLGLATGERVPIEGKPVPEALPQLTEQTELTNQIHVHHWKIPTDAAQVEGICTGCPEHRLFNNRPPAASLQFRTMRRKRNFGQRNA